MTVFREMTDEEARASLALGACSFSVGTFDKRFARGLSGSARTKREITDKQAAVLWRLVYRYRRQIPEDAIVDFAMRRVEADNPCSCEDEGPTLRTSETCARHGDEDHRRVTWKLWTPFMRGM